MKKRGSTGIIQLTAVCLVFAVLVSSSTFVLAAPGAKVLSAEIIVSGSNNIEKPSVLLNGEPAISGRTFQSSASIVTSENGSAIINLGKLGRVNLAPGSTLHLSFAENNISGELTAGQIKVLNSEGVSVNIRTPDNVVTNDAAQSGNLTIDVRSGLTEALAESGAAYLNGKPAQQKDDDDDDNKKAGAVLLFTFIGVVATAVVLTMVLGDEENVTSPVR